MHRPSLTSLVWVAVAAFPFVANALDPHPYLWHVEERSDSSKPTVATIVAQLGAKLSTNSTIFAQDDPRWDNATERWQASYQPSFSIVVEPATEADVSVIVKYANSRSIPFLATNRRHGSTVTLGRLKNGIEISLSLLNGIVIAEDKQSAYFQGGVYDGQAIDALWELGYVTGTGSCACVGMMGPALGGGHGRYQGFYGLIADMVISLNVVLADGSAVVVSATSHTDLWWAMRGAGHNFGIVTSFHSKIYERTVDAWTIGEFVFTQNQLESVFTVLNKQQENGVRRKELMSYSAFHYDDRFPSEGLIIDVFLHYVGTPEEAAPYLDMLYDLGPLYNSTESLPYPDVLDATGTGMDSPVCQDGYSNMQFPFGLLKHNLTTTRQIYNYFESVITSTPALQGSVITFEAYSLEAVQAIDAASTAYPHRDDNIIGDVIVTYEPDTALDPVAVAVGKNITEFWALGQPHREKHVYLNYAYGDEPLEQMYGSEPWRLEKLRAIKAKHDPDNAFRFYNPIV